MATPHAHHRHHADHAHQQGHAHQHAPASFGRAFAIGITIPVRCGRGLLRLEGRLARAAGRRRPQPGRRGRPGAGLGQRASILAAFANALLLLVAMGSLAWEAFGRLHAPQPTQGFTVMVVAGIGIFVNLGTALLFMRGCDDDLNIRGAYLHMASGALVSAGVVVVGALALWTGWAWLDPAASLVIALVVVAGTWGLFRHSLRLMFDGVPEHIDLAATRQLRERFRIGHVTLQVVREPFMTLCEGAAGGSGSNP